MTIDYSSLLYIHYINLTKFLGFLWAQFFLKTKTLNEENIQKKRVFNVHTWEKSHSTTDYRYLSLNCVFHTPENKNCRIVVNILGLKKVQAFLLISSKVAVSK